MPTSKILWGSDLAGELVLAYPLFSVVTDRPPRESTEWIRGDSGVEDAWITGRDYEMRCEARWIPDGGQSPSPFSGSQGWQAFLDYARSKGTFRFIPDQDLPGLYIDGCYLADPMRDAGDLTPDILRTIPLVLRNPSIDFHQALRGLLFEYAAGGSLTDPVVAAVTRATGATYHDRFGFVKTVGNNIARDSHAYAGARALLIENARTNSCLRSEEFDNASWVKTGLTVTPNAVLSPDGVNVTMDKLVESAAAGNHLLTQDITITSGENIAISCYIRAAGRTRGRLQFSDATTTNGFRVDFDLAAGTVVNAGNAGAGVLTDKAIVALGNGVFRVMMWGTVNGGVTAGRAWVILEDNTGAISYTGDGTSGLYAWGFQVERLSTTVGAPSSYIATAGATASRNAENPFTWPYGFAPQTATLYARFFDFSPSTSAVTHAILQIGATGFSNPRWYLIKTSNTWSSALTNEDAASSISSSSALASGYGDLVELVAELDATNPNAATVQLFSALNGGAFTAFSAGAAIRLPYAWNAASLVFGLSTSIGYYGIRNVKLAAGVRSATEMRAL